MQQTPAIDHPVILGKASVNPGDKVLVPNPGYPTYTSLSKLLGAQVVNYNLRPENDWQPDFEELESMDLSGVKLLFLFLLQC